MKFFSSVFTVAALVLSVVSAQDQKPNPISKPGLGEVIHAGAPYTITWTNNTVGTVSLNLKKGEDKALDPVLSIVTNTENTGVFLWSIDENLPAGDDYAIEIISKDDQRNYAGPFTIKSKGKPKSTMTTTASSSSITHSSNSSTISMNTTTLVTTTTHHNKTTSTIEPTTSGNATTITSFSKTATKTSATATSASATASETAGATRVSGAGTLMAVAAIAAALVL